MDTVHVVLLGDSTLDNGRYLNAALGEMSVGQQLEKWCAERKWRLTVLAQDGSLLDDVLLTQLPQMPETATHLVLSASGNDLLQLLNQMVAANFSLSSMYDAVSSGLQRVAVRYQRVVAELKRRTRHLACCTVYRPNFNQFFFKSLAVFSLSIHNSRLMQIAQDFDSSVIDLASMFDAGDFANPLELNTRGGAKLVDNILVFVGEHPPRFLLLGSPGVPGSPMVVHVQDDVLYPGAPPTAGAGGLQLLPQLCCCQTQPHVRRIYSQGSAEAPSPSYQGSFLEGRPDFPQSPRPNFLHTGGGVVQGGMANPHWGFGPPPRAFSEAQQHWRDGGR